MVLRAMHSASPKKSGGKKNALNEKWRPRFSIWASNDDVLPALREG